MSANVNVEVLGVKEAIRSLNKLEPGLRKQFAAEVNQIAQPAIVEAQSRYTTRGVPLSGMSRNWTSNGRKLFPFDPRKASRSVKVKLEGDRRVTASIVITQSDAATSIYETAGRVNKNQLGDSLGSLAPGRTRIFGPAVYSKTREITEQIKQASLKVVRRVENELR